MGLQHGRYHHSCYSSASTLWTSLLRDLSWRVNGGWWSDQVGTRGITSLPLSLRGYMCGSSEPVINQKHSKTNSVNIVSIPVRGAREWTSFKASVLFSSLQVSGHANSCTKLLFSSRVVSIPVRLKQLRKVLNSGVHLDICLQVLWSGHLSCKLRRSSSSP